MKTFNVLDRDLILHQHYLIEASAGTGKTFSIQNIVIRLLIEASQDEMPLLFSKILIVTFTKAATRDLKLRIRHHLEQMLSIFDQWLKDQELPEKIPDYLLAFLEEGRDFVKQAKKRLQQAFFHFDQAQIFTIHSFCFRMLRQFVLEGDMGLHAAYGDEPLSQSEILAVIRDFFRTEMRIEAYSPAQLAIILKEDPDQKKLLKVIQSGYEFDKLPSFSQLAFQFQTAMDHLKTSLNLTADQMIEDFKAQAQSYRNHKSGETKADTLSKVSRFASLFDKDQWDYDDLDLVLSDGLVWVDALHPTLLKNKSSSIKLIYPNLTQQLQEYLFPIIQLGRDFSILLARLACDCQGLLKRYQREEEKLSPDDLLKKMDWALHQPMFIKQIQEIYRAVIIDEFQDTDPLQWKIFKRLFLPEDHSWKGHLYLVGDPKQSIYSFRQADIYTYLSAAQTLGNQRCFSLETNYRSQPSLVLALNTLFAAEHIPDLIPLPKQNFYLPYQSVQAAQQQDTKVFNDGKGAVHFFITEGKHLKRLKLSELETDVFFPYLAHEIKRLKENEGWNWRQFAILVRDRYQALRLTEFLEQEKIPYLNQRGTSLAEAPALKDLIAVIQAILHADHLGFIKAALGSFLIGWTYEKMKTVEQFDSILILIRKLRNHLIEKGFSSFFQHLLQSSWHVDGLSVVARLLNQEGGLEFYHDLQQIANLVIDHQYKEWHGPEGLIPFLDRLQLWHQNEDARIKRFQDPAKEGVKILTLHFSKGLEFDIVFALGLVNRVSVKEELIPIEKEGKFFLTPLSENCSNHRQYFEENDAEKMRQLYVAMTRAKYRLYLPAIIHLPAEDLKFGEASPMDLFIARFKQPLCDYSEIYQRIPNQTGQNLLDLIDSKGQACGLSYSIHQKIDALKKQQQEGLIAPLIQPKKIEIPGHFQSLSSFSRLTAQLSQSSFEETDSLELPHDFENPIKTIHTLPASHETGILLHQLFKQAFLHDLNRFQNFESALSFVRPLIQYTPFKEWEEVLASILIHIFSTSISSPFSSFFLTDLSPLYIYREMPFLFPCQQPIAIEGIQIQQGLIKGVIDLIFYYQDRYYILDWKSHWLGENSEAYQQRHLPHVMHKHHYFFQANLYAEALKRYLSVVEKRPFKECFGGIFYLFVRGLHPGKETGIYHFLP
jgi:exodeoxyribonuclease V beta subunit